MDNTQEQVDRLLRVNRRIIAVFVLVVCILIAIFGIWLYRLQHTPIDNSQVKALQDSLLVHDRQRAIEYTAIQTKITRDSIRYNTIQVQVNNIPVLLDNINKRYDTKRNHLNNSTPDEQFEFFSDWLSQADSL